MAFEFFKEIKQVTNQYFNFKRVENEDSIVIITSNIKKIKDKYCLIVDNNKGVFLKDWQVRLVKIRETGNCYAVKINRNFFKAFTFSFNFDDMSFEKEDTFEDLMMIAKEQEENGCNISTKINRDDVNGAGKVAVFWN